MASAPPIYTEFLTDNKWTTYLAYQLTKDDQLKPDQKLLRYEALLSQCCYLSRMAYSPADIFCRMTQHLDVTPNAFNNYIRAIEKIYNKLFNYKCSYDSKYVQENKYFEKFFTPISPPLTQPPTSSPIGYFIQNKKKLNVYLYVHHNPESKFNSEKTLFIAFKGSSSISDFMHDLKSAAFPDRSLSELNADVPLQNNGRTGEKVSGAGQDNGKAGYGFIDILKDSIPELCEKIISLEVHEFKRIIITGHSLGGALASLFGYYLRKYKKSQIADKYPIHVITFGACCVFDAIGRNEFNSFLSITGTASSNNKKPIFTLDRVTVNLDPVTVLPADLDHCGYTLLKKSENYAYSRTGRTNEIDELREMFGISSRTKSKYLANSKYLNLEKNDLLLSKEFVELFTNFKNFKVNDEHDIQLYRSKYKIKFGTKAEEQIGILKEAMPDAIHDKIMILFKKIESDVDVNNKKTNGAPGAPGAPGASGGGLKEKVNNNTHKKDIDQSVATDTYKKETINRMPNEIIYSCYKTMSIGFCHVTYMGVTYAMVLRLPGLKFDKPKKEPRKNYTLYKLDNSNRIISLSDSADYTENSDCKQPEQKNLNNINKPIEKKSSSFFGSFGSFFSKSKNKNKNNHNHNHNIEMGNTGNTNSNSRETQPLLQTPQKKSSICSIL